MKRKINYGCDKKFKFKSERKAKLAIRHMGDKSKRLNIYFCNGCKYYHIGSIW